MSRSVLVLGGAGFLGSHVVERFLHAGDRVTVVDGLLPGTGGRAENLGSFEGDLRVFLTAIEETTELLALVEESEIIIDSMAWTAHHLALREPLRDLHLNTASHLPLIAALQAAPRGGPEKTVIYLGSRGQYGKVASAEIREETPMVPEDVQGIHKLAAESHFRVYARQGRFHAQSLRLGNCFGVRQPREGEDLGLIGGFVRDLLAGRTVDVYGGPRMRYLVHAPDVAEVVFQLAGLRISGFSAFNFAGHAISVEALSRRLHALLGCGKVEVRPMPEEVSRLDVGDAVFSDARLREVLPGLTLTPLDEALAGLVQYFRAAG